MVSFKAKLSEIAPTNISGIVLLKAKTDLTGCSLTLELPEKIVTTDDKKSSQVKEGKTVRISITQKEPPRAKNAWLSMRGYVFDRSSEGKTTVNRLSFGGLQMRLECKKRKINLPFMEEVLLTVFLPRS